MKLFKSLLCMVICSLISINFCSCYLDPDHTCNIQSESTELFSEEVLQEFDIPWLSKPEGAANEVQYRDHCTYCYEATINTQYEFTSYVEDIFKEFSERNYTIANYYETVIKGEAWSTQYGFNIAFDKSKTYMVYQGEGIKVCDLYYTTQPLGEFNDEIGGRVVTNVKYLSFVLRFTDENDSCNIEIELYKEQSDLTCYFLDEVPQEE